MTAVVLFSTWTALKALAVALGGAITLLVKWKLKRDAEQPIRAAEKAVQESDSGDDAALNADLDAAEQRLRDKGR